MYFCYNFLVVKYLYFRCILERMHPGLAEIKDMDPSFYALHRRLMTRGSEGGLIVGSSPFTGIGENIGEGLFYNTSASAFALMRTLSILKPAEVTAILQDETMDEDIVRRFVEKKLLLGQKIMDLGCGRAPGYASCVRAMGAEAYTADVQPFIRFPYADMKLRHTEVDLTDPSALELLLANTGGNFDFVGESIIGKGPDFIHGSIPSKEQLEPIAYSLLCLGGKYYSAGTPNSYFVKIE